MLSPDDERVRYDRNIRVPGFGETGQECLAEKRVLVVGLGGLGSPAALYLAAAGIGTLGLLDSDRVEMSNLQRQILHATSRIEYPKVRSAETVLADLNPSVNLEMIEERLVPGNAREVIERFDAVIEAVDNFETKFLINDTCLDLGKPFATAGILSVSGHAMFVVPGKSACLRCSLQEPPDSPSTTAELGVLGPVPGIMGSLEALEVLRWAAGMWRPQRDGAGLLHSIDGEMMRLRTLRVPPRRDCRCSQLWSNEDE